MIFSRVALGYNIILDAAHHNVGAKDWIGDAISRSVRLPDTLKDAAPRGLAQILEMAGKIGYL